MAYVSPLSKKNQRSKRKTALFEKIRSLIKKSIDDPAFFIFTLIGLIRGTSYFIFYNYVKRNIKIGFPFIVHAKVRIIGPGSVSIGRNCLVIKNAFKGLVIITLTRNAKVTIGDNCSLGGTTIRCYGLVEIGSRTMTAISLIQDSFLMNYDRLDDETKQRIPNSHVTIGMNAWLTEASFVMNGSVIGNDSVLSSGSWCYDTSYADYVLISGSPIRSTIPIDKLLHMKGQA